MEEISLIMKYLISPRLLDFPVVHTLSIPGEISCLISRGHCSTTHHTKTKLLEKLYCCSAESCPLNDMTHSFIFYFENIQRLRPSLGAKLIQDLCCVIFPWIISNLGVFLQSNFHLQKVNLFCVSNE